MFRRLIALLLLGLSSPALAGPPYATDDPAPAAPGTVETYLFVEGTLAGSPFDHGAFDGEVEAEINYGAAPDVQLSIAAPISFATGAEAEAAHFGNVEAGVKWRFHNNDSSGLSAAFYPSIELPTERGAHGVEILLPLWAQWERGGWTLFGGGGRRFRTDPDGLDSWEGGIALTREIAVGASLGIETTAEGRNAINGHGDKAVAVGGTLALSGPFALVGRAGPVFEDDTGRTLMRIFFGVQGNF